MLTERNGKAQKILGFTPGLWKTVGTSTSSPFSYPQSASTSHFHIPGFLGPQQTSHIVASFNLKCQP